jgi:hypothetical protein
VETEGDKLEGVWKNAERNKDKEDDDRSNNNNNNNNTVVTTVAKELASCKLDSVGVQEVRWGKGGTVRADD